MITKVTSANYDDYTLLFNQADTALKEFNGEPTGEFVEIKPPIGDPSDDDYEAGDAFDLEVQYFDEGYAPHEFTEATFNARDLTKPWYRLNEQVIYDLDTYFGRLQVLTDIDYSFLRMPIDEPTFNILDDTNGGRRVIEVPEEFSTGISVQGDETAEILFFSIDRYYDATDLWTPEMNFVIQWKAGDKQGVTRAFINKDSRAFIDDEGKLYFGWPISSEITEEAGDVTFSVRAYRFSEGNYEDGRPKLAFGLNTQTATVRINPSLDFKILSETEFKDAQSVSKTSDIVSRVFNSTVISKEAQVPAPTPVFEQDILPWDETTLARTALSVKEVEKVVYTLAIGVFDEEETYYNADHEEVTGLNASIYHPGIYYTADVTTQKFYEFDYEDVKDKVQ